MDEPFPFNLDEFVTVDEIQDEAEERTPSSSGRSKLKMSEDDHKSSAYSSSDRFKKPLTLATPKSRPSAATRTEDQETKDMMENERVEKIEGGVTVTTHVLQEAVHQTVFGEIEKEETLTPKFNDKDKKSIVQINSKEASFTNKEMSNKGAFNLHKQNHFEKDEPLQVSKLQERKSPAKHESEKLDTALQESKELPSQDALVTLDEVGGEDGEEVDEEELLKRQAGENPEALLTVDEVGGDEPEGEEEQLEKALQGLVTLDEIVEDEDEDDASSFNPEVSIFTLPSLGLQQLFC